MADSSEPEPFSEGTVVLHVPVNGATVLLFLCLLGFSFLGCVHLWRQLSQHRCHCPLCKGDYVLVEKIGSGGFASCWIVGKRKGSDTFVAKLIPVSDLNDATEAQKEGRELRALKHPRIVRLVDEFLHVIPTGLLAGLTGRASKEASQACAELGAPPPPQSGPGGPALHGQIFVCLVMERCKQDLRRYIADVRKGLINPHLPLLPPMPSSQGTSGAKADPLYHQPTPAKPMPSHLRYVPEEIIWCWAAQLISALRYLAKNSVVHRDIKTTNIFVAAPAVMSTAAHAHAQQPPPLPLVGGAFPLGLGGGAAQKAAATNAAADEDELYFYREDDDYDEGDNDNNGEEKDKGSWEVGPLARKRGQSSLTSLPSGRRRRASSNVMMGAPSSSSASAIPGLLDGSNFVDLSRVDSCKLGDFGLAKTTHRARTKLTEAGTDVYKSPEAIEGGKRDGTKGDVFSLGLVLVELLTCQFTWEREGSLGAQILAFNAKSGKGKPGSGGKDPLQRLLSSLEEAPASAADRHRYTPALRLLVKKCLTPDERERPSAEQLFRFKLLRDALSNRIAPLSMIARQQQQHQQQAQAQAQASKSLPTLVAPSLSVQAPVVDETAKAQPGTAATTALPAAASAFPPKPAQPLRPSGPEKAVKRAPLSPQREEEGHNSGGFDNDEAADGGPGGFIVVQQKKRGQHRSQSRPQHQQNPSTGSTISAASLLSTDSFVAQAQAPLPQQTQQQGSPQQRQPLPISPALATAVAAFPAPVPLPIALPATAAQTASMASAAAALAIAANAGAGAAARLPPFPPARAAVLASPSPSSELELPSLAVAVDLKQRNTRRESGGSHGSSRTSENDRAGGETSRATSRASSRGHGALDIGASDAAARQLLGLGSGNDSLNRSWQAVQKRRNKKRKTGLAGVPAITGTEAAGSAAGGDADKLLLRHASDGDDEGEEEDDNDEDDGAAAPVAAAMRQVSGDTGTGGSSARWTQVKPHRRHNKKKAGGLGQAFAGTDE